MFFPKPNSEYGEGVELDEYKGTWSLVSARMGKDNKVYKEWVYPQARTEKGETNRPIDKCLPWKIEIGKSKDEAVKFLEAVLQVLENDAISGGHGFGVYDQTQTEDLDVPF
jgi:hypothetical protein